MTFHAHRYPANWREIRAAILARAGNRCECQGCDGQRHEAGRCNAGNGTLICRDPSNPGRWCLHEHTGACCGEPCGAIKVVLTVAHLDHNESHNDPSNLAALCQRCHLTHDRADNARRRRANARAARAVGELPKVPRG